MVVLLEGKEEVFRGENSVFNAEKGKKEKGKMMWKGERRCVDRRQGGLERP